MGDKGLNGAEQRGIADRFVPVLQGRHPNHYLRCLERMPFVLDRPLVGIGSMCRRHVEGEHGILHVLDVLDRAFSGTRTKFHLFGLKSQGIDQARMHPRVASCDSQAYGVAARQTARKARTSKPDALVAQIMAEWFEQQQKSLAGNAPSRRTSNWPKRDVLPISHTEARIAEAAEDLRALHEAGEIDWNQLSAQAAYEWAFMDD